MVAHRRHAVVAATLLGLVLPGCGSTVDNSAPRVSAVPVQSTKGGKAYTFDLKKYVKDAEGATLTYTVVSGGGSFTGSVYTNTFDTLGTYKVEFKVTDHKNKTATGTFQVIVQTANLAVIKVGNNLTMLDSDTQKLRTVTGATGFTDTFKATLATGHIVYERTNGTTRLFVYDPSTAQTTTLGDSVDFNSAYKAKTSDNRVIFTRTSKTVTTDSDLYIWNPKTGLISTISAVAGHPDTNPFVTTTNVVYYETGTPTDIYAYTPSTNTVALVSAAATGETIRAILPNNAVVFTIIGGGGEQDLHYYHPTTGVVQIGADLSAAIQNQTKTYKGANSDSVVMFEVSGASIDLYVWSPTTGTSTAVATTGDDDTFAAVTKNKEFVFYENNTATEKDIRIYTHGAATPVRTISATGDDETYQGALSNGDVVILIESGTGNDLHLYDTSAPALNALAVASADNYTFKAVLDNDQVAYELAGAGGGVFVVNTTGAPAPDTVAGPGSTFAGATTGGDIVAQTTVTAQFDLVLWDESASAVVTISNVTGNDAFGSHVTGDDILFTRVTTGKTTADLFIWDPASTTTKQLTNTTLAHSVVSTFAADTTK